MDTTYGFNKFMSALGWHPSVIRQSFTLTRFVSFRSLTPLSRLVPPSLLLNTGVPSECTETNLIPYRSTEVTTAKNPHYSCKKYVHIRC